MGFRVTRSIVPNLFTLGNLFSGFLAIVSFAQSVNDERFIPIGALYVLAAAIFDMLDGIVARLVRSASELGVELDSLCDLVSFGIAPSVLLYVVYYHNTGPIGTLLAALPAMAGAYRLARFNVQLTSLEDKQYFRGLPIPAAALTVVSYVVFYLHRNIIPADWVGITTNFVTITVALAMISTIRYDNIPRPNRHAIAQRPIFTVLAVLALGLIIVSKGSLAFPIMLIYIFGGALRHTIGWLKQRSEESTDFDEFED